MELIEKKENQMKLKVNIEESLANAIRRYVLQIPTLAIDEVEIIKNGSALYDEVLAHRLGLVPIKTEKISEGKLKLIAEKEGMVKSGELIGNVDVIYKNIPLTFLDKNQELEVLAEVRFGKGAQHVKFSPGLIFYRNVSEITTDKSLLENIRRVCPDANIQEKADKIIIIDDGAKEIKDICEGIIDSNNKKADVEVKDSLIISIESFGQIDTKDIFKKSIDALKKDLAEVSKKIK